MARASAYRLSQSAHVPVCGPVEPLGRSAAVAALRRRLATLRPELELSPSGYVASIEDNLLPGVEMHQFVDDFGDGDGRELAWKILAVHSSAALAVNTFARFKHEPGHLPLAGISGFSNLAFEAKCPTGLRRGRPPNLDLVALGPAGVVAVESKCTEHLQPTAPRFSPDYAKQIQDERRDGPWFRAMELMRAERETFELLDAAQLIKDAFGLACCFAGRPVTLLYLYWEPTDAERHAVFRQHRREVERLTCLVAGGFPAFQALSYLDLWQAWQAAARPHWLRDHLAHLRARYQVAIG